MAFYIVCIYIRMNGEKWQWDVCCCAKKKGKAENVTLRKQKINEKKRDLWNIFLVVENGKSTYSIEQ